MLHFPKDIKNARVLLANDDSIHSHGFRVLEETMKNYESLKQEFSYLMTIIIIYLICEICMQELQDYQRMLKDQFIQLNEMREFGR